MSVTPRPVIEDLSTFLSGHLFWERVFLASAEVTILAALVALIVRLGWVRSFRLQSCLWLTVLARPLVTLVLPGPLVLFEWPMSLETPQASTLALHAEATPAVSGPVVRSALAGPEGASGSSPPRLDRSEDRAASASAIHLEAVLWVAWSSGLLLLLARYARLQGRLRCWRRASTPAPRGAQQLFREIWREMRSRRRPPRLRQTGDLESPALVGVLRPTVLVPCWLTRAGQRAKLRWCLRHELAHWRWGDPLAVLVRDVAGMVFFFHPVLKWVARRHAEATELACDRSALQSEEDAMQYAEQLYEILSRLNGRPGRALAGAGSASLVGMARTRMRARMEALLDGTVTRSAPATRRALALTALLVCASFACGSAMPWSRPAGADPAAPLERDDRPSLFVLSDCGAGEVFRLVSERTRDKWGRGHDLEHYDRLFGKDGEAEEGDLVVLLFAGGFRMPEAYHTMLPVEPEKLRQALQSGETLDVKGRHKGLHVIVLAAPAEEELLELLYRTETLEPWIAPDTVRGPMPDRMEWVRPSLFVWNVSERQDLFEKVFAKARSNTGDKWGRVHSEDTYRDLFENAANPFQRRDGDLMLVMWAADSQDAIPERFRDLFAMPWEEVLEKLGRGERVRTLSTVRGMHVLAVAEARSADLHRFVEDTETMQRFDRPPTLYTLLPGGAGAFEPLMARVANATGSQWGRGHDEDLYDDLFADPTDPLGRRPGDLVVLLFTLEDRKGRVPERFAGLLPEPWKSIEAHLRNGESYGAKCRSHGANVVVLAAPTSGELRKLVQESPLLSGPFAEVAAAPAPQGDPRQPRPSGARPSYMFLGGDGDAFRAVTERIRRADDIWGRGHEQEIYRQIFEEPANPFELHRGDQVVLLFALDDSGRVPEEFAEVLPQPWSVIEARLREGKEIELPGEYQGFPVLVLATPVERDLAALIRKTELLGVD